MAAVAAGLHALGGQAAAQLGHHLVHGSQVGQRPGRQCPVQLAQRPCRGQAAGALDLASLELCSQQCLEAAQPLARQPLAPGILGGQIGLGLGAQAERPADALDVHADHARALLAAPERGDRHSREVAHRALRAVPQRGGDLCTQGLQIFGGELFEVDHPALVALAHVLPQRRELDGAEEETLEYQLEDAPVLLALCERRRERLPEVLPLCPIDLAQHRERVQ